MTGTSRPRPTDAYSDVAESGLHTADTLGESWSNVVSDSGTFFIVLEAVGDAVVPQPRCDTGIARNPPFDLRVETEVRNGEVSVVIQRATGAAVVHPPEIGAEEVVVVEPNGRIEGRAGNAIRAEARAALDPMKIRVDHLYRGGKAEAAPAVEKIPARDAVTDHLLQTRTRAVAMVAATESERHGRCCRRIGISVELWLVQGTRQPRVETRAIRLDRDPRTRPGDVVERHLRAQHVAVAVRAVSVC